MPIKHYSETDVPYLKLLAKQYPSIQAVCSEMINLRAILKLPKGTEHFLSDLHGEYESFTHILRNASGVIRTKIDAALGHTASQEERRTLATIIYYPREKLEIIRKQIPDLQERNEFYRITLYRLIEVCRLVTVKYTRARILRALPKEFEYLIDELLQSNNNVTDKQNYYEEIIDSIIELRNADAFITALSELIQNLAVDRLHIIGDVFDRGPGAHIIMDALLSHPAADMQWGNHDVLWMGAASGNDACIANVIRISTRYNNLDTLEHGYGISLRQLTIFAMDRYRDDPCSEFFPNVAEQSSYNKRDMAVIAKLHKAITMIQFKLEAQIIRRNPNYHMDHMLLLDKIDYADRTVEYEGKTYALKDSYFPTVSPENPFALTDEEKAVVEYLNTAFRKSDKLQQHVRCLYEKGSMYLRYNNNLLYHGCIPLDEAGEFAFFETENGAVSGKTYIDYADRIARQAYLKSGDWENREKAVDFLWYLWCGPISPLYGKSKMTTFERYFINDPITYKEHKNPYYRHVEKKEVCIKILNEFGLTSPESHIINGHVPVQIKKGESPIKGEGKLLVIDGGLSKAYQKHTGIAGYTLIFNSQGLQLASHEPFESTRKAIEEEKDIHSTKVVLERLNQRFLVSETEEGASLHAKLRSLGMLLQAYRDGILRENNQLP